MNLGLHVSPVTDGITARKPRIIYENGSGKLIDETCRICKFFKSKKIML